MCGRDDTYRADNQGKPVADPAERSAMDAIKADTSNRNVSPASNSTLEAIKEYLAILADFRELCIRYTGVKDEDGASFPEGNPGNDADAHCEDDSEDEVDFDDEYDSTSPIRFEYTDEDIDFDCLDGDGDKLEINVGLEGAGD